VLARTRDAHASSFYVRKRPSHPAWKGIERVRVSTAFNKILGVVGAGVTGVCFSPAGVVVSLRRRRHKLRCACGFATWATYDTRRRRWRHLDLGGNRCWLEADVRRLECRRCGGVRTEVVPWARPDSRHSRDFEDVVAYLAQHTDKTTVTKLMRCSWEAVARIVTVVVADHLDGARLEGLARIGVDEINYRKGHRFLTVVADHDHDGVVVWAGEGRSSKTLEAFYDELGPERCARLEAVSLDMGNAYQHATDTKAAHARQCVDPFHVVKLANTAVDKARRWGWNEYRRAGHRDRGPLGRTPADSHARWIKHTRWALVKDPAALSDNQLDVLDRLRRSGSVLYRCWQLKEGVRDLYRVEAADAPAHLEWWLAWACRCRVPAFVALSKTVRANRERILAAIELGLSNSRLEGTNSKIRLINHRGYGHSATAMIAMIYLCCGGVTVELPLR
jgi:transposase